MPRPSFAIDRLLGTREPALRTPDSDALRRAADVRASIDPTRLAAVVASLPGPRSRLHAPEALEAAELAIAEELVRCGWVVERQPFHVDHEPGVFDVPAGKRTTVYPTLDGANLVAVREGTNREAIVVVAHHDTIRDSAGADDNGSGMAVLLEVGRILGGSSPTPPRTLVLAFPDFEEIGLIGSRVLVERLRAERPVSAAIVLDAVGFRSRAPRSQHVPPGIEAIYPGPGRRMRASDWAADFVAILYRRSSRPLARRFGEVLAALPAPTPSVLLRDPLDLRTVGPLLRRVSLARNFSRSDHQRFWDAGIPAILVSDTGNFRNPHYHRPSDTAATLDPELLADVAAATVLTVEALIEGIPPPRR